MPAQDLRRSSVLFEENRLDMLAFVPKEDVDAFAGLYAEEEFYSDLCRKAGFDWDFTFLRKWLDRQLRIGASREGWRSNQTVEIEKGLEPDKMRSEAFFDPEYDRSPTPPKKGPGKGVWRR